ncbi:Anaphase spindle elongation protein 1 [Escovopsis weberi]|uniref:Anaphase spindle elongation protein 1 n=1 Tax=Escovopsis weberi TaxID=150374 RepID=A0A0M8MRH5_ESCWE|nr:Anaphase spindle elongation protein 1 [Escovopsis weberi]
MDASHLGEQIEGSIDQLHILFDEIGVPTQEREKRETELFVALSEALNRYVRLVGTEKKDLIDEAKKTIVAIRQMETSLEDPKRRESGEREDLKITFPLVRCLQVLRDRHGQVARLHKERYEQVMKLAEALESYSSHLEPAFVQIALPPTGPNRSIPLTFDLSPSYVHRLDSEFTRVYDEYTRRLVAVQALGEHIVQLWAELGVPQNQQDAAINKYYRDAPEQLGLHEEDIDRLSSTRDKLSEEKKSREKRLLTLKAAIEDLWDKLGVNEEETKAFLQENEGYGIRQIGEFEAELERLNELKRQNLQYFIEDTRITLQELWDSLYFSEDDMLEFTPAFSDAYSDALLEAHEREVKRLVALKEERAPTLSVVAKYKSLIKDRDELIASSQDSSRLMLRGQKGEKRDPGKLLREEKMRKRIAKELPRVLVEVRKALEQWEEERGKPFLVYGERFLNELEAEEESATATAKRQPPRTRTPAPALTAVKMPGSAQARATSSHSNTSSAAPSLKSRPRSRN